MNTETITTLAQDFFTKLWVDFSELLVQKETDNIFRINLKSNDSHILIWPHGKNLENITYLLRTLIQGKTESFINIHVEINDYLEKKEEKLLRYIQGKIDYVKESGKEIILPFLSAYERKKVHSYVSENGGGIYTQSQWEGKERRIHLCKKDEKMTIDIDGDDI